MLESTGLELHREASVKLGGILIVRLVQSGQGFSIDGRRPRVNTPDRWCGEKGG